jgi:hypothetical protein
MADDLKPMLTKVLASGGEKKFFFAFGSGKRKDGKGEGELAVSGQKPKKAAIEGALADCKEVFEGCCWTGNGPDNKDTVYFQGNGKKLSTGVVAKMALTAKRVTANQYDFQIPSAEEESRVAKLAPEPDGASPQDTPAANESPGAADLAAEWKKKSTDWTLAIKVALAAKGPNTPAIAKLLAQAVAQSKPGGDMAQALAKLTECHALATGAVGQQNKAGASDDAARWTTRRQTIEARYLKAIKEQPDKASQLRAVLGFADRKAEAKDFGKALLGLDKLETLMQGAGETVNGADPVTEWQKKSAEWTPAIKAALAAKGPSAAAIAKLFAQATALSKPGGDMAQALAKLTECHALAASATVAAQEGKAGMASKSAATAQTSEEQAQPGEEPKTPTARWEAARDKVLSKLLAEIKMVVATKHAKAGEAELELKAVLRQLKGEMRSKKQAVEMERYLKDDDVVADVCKLAFDMKTPLLKVVAEIKDQLAA